MNTEWILNIYVPIITIVFLSAFTLYIIRVLKGPTIPDMVLSIDCLGYDLAVFIGLLSLYYNTSFLIIGSLMIALWAFIFDVYISKYFIKGDMGE